jgi:hypothetical protein
MNSYQLNEDGKAAVESFKQQISSAVLAYTISMPNSREKSVFITQMETAIMWGTYALCQNPCYNHGYSSFPLKNDDYAQV